MSDFEIQENSEKERFLLSYRGKDRQPEIPGGIVAIGDDAFIGNTFVEKITVPEGVESIGSYAFSSCPELKQVVLPESLQEINLSAFENCSRLSQINIPEKVRIIGSRAFHGCPEVKITSLPDFLVEVFEDSFDSPDIILAGKNIENCQGLVYNQTSRSLLFARDKNLETVKVLNGTVYLGWNCLSGLKKLRNLSIPATVRYIGRGACMFSKSLEKIIIPDSVESIDTCAFMDCTSLKEVIVQGQGLSFVADNAFSGCSSLATVTIPEKCQVCENAFEKECRVKRRLP